MKKRRFLALLLAIVMAVSITPLAGYAAETDECYLSGGDGTGDESAEPMMSDTHEHTVRWGYWTDDNGRSGHHSYCITCGVSLSDYEEHIMAGGTCTVCGYHPCGDGNHVYFPDISESICTICWTETDCVDENRDCVCDVCGLATHHDAPWKKDETYHWLKCVDCGKELRKETHTDRDDDGICDICFGAFGPCKHKETWSYSQYGHYSYCSRCGEDMSEFTPHTMVDGMCTVCGYHPCEEGKHVYGTSDYAVHVCQTCGYQTDCVDGNGDCVCDLCGYEKHNSLWIDGDKTSHWWHCDVCGKDDLWKENHTDNNGDGVCDICQYQVGSHEHTAQWDYICDGDNSGHYTYCSGCYLILSDVENHTMVNGTCTVCGFHPCEEGKHVYGTSGYQKHYCQICGYYTGCIDANKDCLCDICGSETHSAYETKVDETFHWWHCDVCGKDGGKEKHQDKDNDGKCDSCEYVMSTSTGEKADTIPVYRLYNQYTNEHLLVSEKSEKDGLVNAGWNLDGVAWNAPKEGATVYRLYNPYDDFHFYTLSLEEINTLTPLGWTVDGPVSYSAGEDGTPVFRLFNPYEMKNYHMFTASEEERDYLTSLGWVFEGIAWYSSKN